MCPFRASPRTGETLYPASRGIKGAAPGGRRILTGVRTAVAPAALLAAVALGATAAPARAPARLQAAAAPRMVLTIGGKDSDHLVLRAVAGATLKPLPQRGLSIGNYSPWLVSPDGRRVVLAHSDGGGAPSIRILDVAGWKVGPRMFVGDGTLRAVAWTSPTTLLLTGQESVLVNVDPCCGRTWLQTVDVTTGTVGTPQEYAGGGTAWQPAAWPGGVASLKLPVTTQVDQQGPGIAPATFELDGPGQAARTVALDRIVAGQNGDPNGENGHYVYPGLIIDDAASHAYVAGTNDVLADIDLASLQVTYHDVGPTRSLASRLRDAFDPPAEAKGASGNEPHHQHRGRPPAG